MPDDTEKKTSLDSRSPEWNPDPHPETAPAPKSGVERELIAMFDGIVQHLGAPAALVRLLAALRDKPPAEATPAAPAPAAAAPAAKE